MSETSFGYRTVPVDEKQGLVNTVFDSVASRYDVMNDAMSGGLHRLWKDAMVSWLAPPRRPRQPYNVLDVAGGTGDIALRIGRRVEVNGFVTVADINTEMLAVGQERADKSRRSQTPFAFLCANAEALPIAANSQSAYTIAFGIRNVTNRAAALKEAHRVLKRGGRFLCLEFSHVDVPVMDKVYDLYSFHAIPQMGEWIAGDRDSYRYLVESIRMFPNPGRFAAEIERAGFGQVKVRMMTGGVAALHSAFKI